MQLGFKRDYYYLKVTISAGMMVYDCSQSIQDAEIEESCVLEHSQPWVYKDTLSHSQWGWRGSRQNFGGLCQFEKNMTFKLYQYVCWCIRHWRRFILMENDAETEQALRGNQPGRSFVYT